MPLILIIVAIAALSLGGAVYFKNSNNVATTTETTTSVTSGNAGIADMLGDAQDAADAMENNLGGNTNAPTTQTAEETSVYTNGAYTKTGTYASPAGDETVTISVTLADDVIASATFTGNATNPGSVANQKKFAAGYTDLVVGKNIDEIDLTVVNGSSLTPEGFMNALASVKTAARI